MNVNSDGGKDCVHTGPTEHGRHSGVKRALVGLLLAGLLTVGVVGFAGGHPKGHGPRDTYAQMDLEHLHAVFEHLMATATPERQAAMKAVGGAAHAELQALNQQALDAHRRKVDLLLQDTIDRKAFDRARTDEIEAAARLARRIDAVLVGLAELMTPEQRGRLLEHRVAQRG